MRVARKRERLIGGRILLGGGDESPSFCGGREGNASALSSIFKRRAERKVGERAESDRRYEVVIRGGDVRTNTPSGGEREFRKPGKKRREGRDTLRRCIPITSKRLGDPSDLLVTL